MPEDSISTRPAETRRLAAIMFTDIVGFSRQMGADETRMLRLLEIHNQIIQQVVAEHHGHVIKSTGDGFLVEFPSVVNAVRCAQQIQSQFRAYNAEKKPSEQLHLRIGIHLGDIVQQNGDVQGDGVNIAARLQPLAEPDTICISQKVYEEVAQKVALGTVVPLGRPKLKNIVQRFLVYTLLAEQPKGIRQALWVQKLKLKQKKRSLQVGVMVLALLLVSVGTLMVRSVYFPGPVDVPLPDKPSIAVLPFVNMSGDPGQEYFSDGITEDLTTDLSQLSGLFVIARNSAFTYKGKAVKVEEVGRELGVRYVVEGSVRKTEDQVRITVQLVDATTGHHLWAERYDRPLQDVFALQDEIVQRIIQRLNLFLGSKAGFLMRKTTTNLEAYDAFLRGQDLYWRSTKETVLQARQLYERAVALDPQYAQAYASLGATYYIAWLYRWSPNPQTLEQAEAMAQQAVALDDTLPAAHGILSLIYNQQKQYDRALAAGERALAVDPNNAYGYIALAEVLNQTGRPAEALQRVKQAMRLNPHYPPWYAVDLSISYYLLGRYTEAIALLEGVLAKHPQYQFAYFFLSSSYALQWAFQLSQEPRALEQAAEVAQRGITLQETFPWHHVALGYVYLLQKQYEQALAEVERAIAVDPYVAESYCYASLAEVLSYAGRLEDSWRAVEQALQRSPVIADWHLASVGVVYALTGQAEKAIAPLQRFLRRYPNHVGAHLTLAAVYSEIGKETEARGEAAEVLRLNPQFSLEGHKQRAPIQDPAILERHVAALRKAGLK